MRLCCLAFGVSLLATLALPGQAPEARERPRIVRDEAFRMAEAYLVSNIQSSLGLSDDEFTKVFPLVRQVQNARRRLIEERAERLRNLRHLLASGTANEGSVDGALKAVKAAETEGPPRLREAMNALDAALTPLQQAKYRVLEADVEARIRRLLTRGGRDGRNRRLDRPHNRAQ